ncbi:MAG: hypothetical protein ABSF64_32045 [Bryobacteraceae bacterium]
MLSRSCVLLLAALPCMAGSDPQLVWFSPEAPGDWPDGRVGQVDYIDLFTPGAPWPNAASHVQVFKFAASEFVGDLPGELTDGQWQQVFANLAQRGIALAVEFGPLSAATCGAGVEGFSGGAALLVAQKIQSLGASLQYVAMDEPFYYGNIYTGQNACNWTAPQIAAGAVQSIAQIRTVFPTVIVGDIEPVPAGTPGWLASYTAWLDAWQIAAGSPLAFFHCDVDWDAYSGWIAGVNSMRQALAIRGIPFGLIYNGLGMTSDASWMSAAESHFLDYELHGGAIPDQTIFQTWETYPTHVLPETDPDALTYLVDYYYRTRTSLSLTSTANQASGKLLDNVGNPIPSAPVVLTLQPVAGPGVLSTYTITGTVPTAATDVSQAVVQICINECDPAQGPVDMNVYSYQYADAGTNATQNFTNGLTGWGVQGPPDGNATVQIASDAGGPSLLIQATAAQQTWVNSSPFAVTPGSSFNLTVQARVAPASTGNAILCLVFLIGGVEVDSVAPRVTLPFTPGTASLGSVQTGSDGSYSLAFPPQAAGVFQLQASFAGSDTLWPAFVSAPMNGAPSINTNGIVNAADYQAEPLSPGAWFTVFGQNLGAAGVWSSADTTVLGGASVSVCGFPAAVSYNSGPPAANSAAGWQIDALAPDGAAGQSSCPVVVTVNGQASPPVSVATAAAVMELFLLATPSGALPIVTHADYSLVGPGSAGLNPAKPGEALIAWGTGDCTLPAITVGNASATVFFSGRVAAGLCQTNFYVPNSLSGPAQLQVSTSMNSYILWVVP